jgi:hypothetical protein
MVAVLGPNEALHYHIHTTYIVGKHLRVGSKLSLYHRIIGILRIALKTRKKKTNILKFFELAILQTLLSGIEQWEQEK